MPITQDRIFDLVTAGTNMRGLVKNLNEEFEKLIQQKAPHLIRDMLVIKQAYQPLIEDIEVLVREQEHYKNTASRNDRKKRYAQDRRGKLNEADSIVLVGRHNKAPMVMPSNNGVEVVNATLSKEELAVLGLAPNAEVEVPAELIIEPDDMEIDKNSPEWQEFIAANAENYQKAGLIVEIPITIEKGAGSANGDANIVPKPGGAVK